MQDDIEHCKGCGQRVGAYIAQLQTMMETITATDIEALQAVQALLAAYETEEVDESRPDKADEFARKWFTRLRALLRSPHVVEIESQGEEIVNEQAGVMEGMQEEVTQRRQERARLAQREEDRVMREALAEASGSGSSGSAVVTTQSEQGRVQEVAVWHPCATGPTGSSLRREYGSGHPAQRGTVCAGIGSKHEE